MTNLLEENKLIYYIKKWSTITDSEAETIRSSFEEFRIKKKKDLVVEGDICKYM